ncbi:leucine-rich repeat protein [Tanacetum coccineum]|uniref:Leucine-rich repeat protein n=1 Tax=Tanacetum coccineum TaxID=301880 RepID=A0ABQ4XFQ0_9ASTR
MSTTLVFLPLETKTSKQTPTDDEPPSKKTSPLKHDNKEVRSIEKEKEKFEESVKKFKNPANILAHAKKIVEYEAKIAKILAVYNHYITFRADQRQITKINYRIDRITKDVTMRIERDNQPLSLTVFEKFRNLKAKFEWLKTQAEKLGLPPPMHLGFLVLKRREKEPLKCLRKNTPEAKEMYMKLEFAIVARNDEVEAKKIVKENLDGFGMRNSPILRQMGFLRILNLSFNDFEGEVPVVGVLANASVFLVLGNNRICGGLVTLELPKCKETISKKKRVDPGAPVSGPILTRSSLLAALFKAREEDERHQESRQDRPGQIILQQVGAIWTLYPATEVRLPSAVSRMPYSHYPATKVRLPSAFIIRGPPSSYGGIWLESAHVSAMKKRNSQPSQSLNEMFLKVSYNQLLDDTDGFSTENLIGEGGFSSVYKGILDSDDDRFVSIKVLRLQNPGANKSFLAECEAWRNIGHRNVLKIITSCSSVDFQGNDFKALVCEFMANGNVSSVLDYLQNRCQTTIVHGDLKPSNILLDDDIVAHVGDFGLARLLGRQLTQNNSTGVKGTIGYSAPEYGIVSKMACCGDVYSFGILLLEVMTGKKPTNDMFNEGLSLHKFAYMALPNHVIDVTDNDAILLQSTDANAKKVEECLAATSKIGVSCSVDSPPQQMIIEIVVNELQRILDAILASSSEVPSVLEFLQRRKLEAKKEVAASEFSHLNHSLSHRPVSVKPDISKPDISKASSAGGKLHILKPSCERNGITPTPKESLSPTSGSKVPNSPLTGESNLLIVKASAD